MDSPVNSDVRDGLVRGIIPKLQQLEVMEVHEILTAILAQAQVAQEIALHCTVRKICQSLGQVVVMAAGKSTSSRTSSSTRPTSSTTKVGTTLAVRRLCLGNRGSKIQSVLPRTGKVELR